jgi:pSer/pThr/pTyr-binding forkhead associated (FHA) protein
MPQPPPDPYAAAGAPAARPATRAVLSGSTGEHAVAAGVDVGVGRDASRCAIVLGEGRVSGLHATLRLEGGQLLARDEASNNGTFVNGNRIPSGAFTPVPAGSAIRFGPVELIVRLE